MNSKLQVFLTSARTWLLTQGLRILLIVVAALILLKLAGILTNRIRRFLDRKWTDPASQQRSETLTGLIRWLLRFGILAVAGFALLPEFGVNQALQAALAAHGGRILLIVASTFVLLKIATLLTEQTHAFFRRRGADPEYQKRSGTLSGVIHWILRVVILTVAVFMVLGELGLKLGPILGTAGIVGLAVGFGAQSLVQDVISGFFILLEDQVRVGDVVEIAGKSGLVEKVNLRMIILRDLSGSVHFVRNGKIDIVTNMTKEYSYYVFDVGVAYREDVDEVIRVLKGIDEEMRQDSEFKNDILAPLDVLGLDSFGDSAIVIKARTKTKPIKQWRIGREFNRRIKKKFDELAIDIPFPHRTIYFGKDKQGASPALNVEMEDSAPAREAGGAEAASPRTGN
jgi:moderate conductance mechanosensitive channel